MQEALSGLIVCLPEASLDDYVGAIEVLVQEGFRTFALPVGEAFGDVVGIFGARAQFGALRVASAAAAVTAIEAGAAFVLADVATQEVADAATERGVVCYLSAMTPSEVRAALALPAAGVLLYPADVVGHAMAARLAELGLADRVIPLGGVGAFAAGEWSKAGSPAVCVDTALLGDALSGGSLAQLRDRCGSFRGVEQKMLERA